MDIEPQDLRLGNWVMFQSPLSGRYGFEVKPPRYVIVSGVSKEWITWDEPKGQSQCETKYIRPIPLTPEILEKSGFNKVSDISYLTRWKHKEEDLDYINIEYIKEKGEYNLSVGSLVLSCDFVHTLQNRFFFLSDFELQIKLK